MDYCNDFAPLLSAFVDGELGEKERALVLDHIKKCEGCRAYLSELMAMHAALEGLPELDAPEFFAEHVMARIRAEQISKKAGKSVRRILPLAACIALLVIAATVLPHLQPVKMDRAAEPTEASSRQTEEESDSADPQEARDGAAMYDAARSEEPSQSQGTEQAPEMQENKQPGIMMAGKEEGDLPAEEEHRFVLFETEDSAQAEEYIMTHAIGEDAAEGWGYLPVSALRSLPEGLVLSEEDMALLHAEKLIKLTQMP